MEQMRCRRSRDREGKRQEVGRDERTEGRRRGVGCELGRWGRADGQRQGQREAAGGGGQRVSSKVGKGRHTVQVPRKRDGHRDGQTPPQGNRDPETKE